MTASRVVVVGGGIAGVAAAWALRRHGVLPTLISQGPGASRMTCGALDLSPWTHSEQALPSELALDFVKELGLRGTGSTVVSCEGMIRTTTAVGARVLALDGLQGKRVGVVDFGRDEFDAERLSVELSTSAWAVANRTKFEALSLPDVLEKGEGRFPLAAFSRLFDDPQRLSRFQAKLLDLDHPPDAVLTGPWLGRGCSDLLAGKVPIGETLSPPEGAFGRRVDEALGRMISGWDPGVREQTVCLVRAEEDSVRVELDEREGERSIVWADAVVLATGGLIGHGVSVKASEDRPVELRPTLGPRPAAVGGARDGWDAAEDGGRWVSSPHWEGQSSGGPRIVYIGDVRSETSARAPGGTFLGAIESALGAVEQLT